MDSQPSTVMSLGMLQEMHVNINRQPNKYRVHKSSAAKYPYTQTDRFPDIIKTKFQPHNQRNRANGIKKNEVDPINLSLTTI